MHAEWRPFSPTPTTRSCCRLPPRAHSFFRSSTSSDHRIRTKPRKIQRFRRNGVTEPAIWFQRFRNPLAARSTSSGSRAAPKKTSRSKEQENHHNPGQGSQARRKPIEIRSFRPTVFFFLLFQLSDIYIDFFDFHLTLSLHMLLLSSRLKKLNHLTCNKD